VRLLAGPEWLSANRRRALDRLREIAPATESAEDWRYGRINELDLSEYEIVLTKDQAEPSLVDVALSTKKFLDGTGPRSALVKTVDGLLSSVDMDDTSAANGLRIFSVLDEDEAPFGFGALLDLVDEPFAAIAAAFCRDVTAIVIPKGRRIDQPIVVVHELSASSDGTIVAPRLLVVLEEGAEAALVQLIVSGDNPVLCIPVLEMNVAQGAHLRTSGVQHLGKAAWQLGYQLAEVGRDATLRSFAAALGGDYTRVYSRAVLAGEAAESQLLAAYLATGSQLQEFRTFQDHVAPRTRSDLTFKGAVADVARSVYSGMIHMRKGARKAEASQTNRNLVLSEGAHADSVPNLDIEENDVRCSHASAVGPIDPDQIFYLEGRGIPPEVAERLVLLGFFDDLLARVPDSGCATYVRDIVAERLAISTGVSSPLVVGLAQ
jgi:Fe-S cluster assembly protein SufD